MSSIEDLKEELNELNTMKFVTSAFTDAAATKLKNIRHAFERNRHFYDEITNIYHLVKTNANIHNSDYHNSETSQNNKTLYVALTSNQHFYGSLNINIMSLFLPAARRVNAEIMVIGSTGLEYTKSVPNLGTFENLILSSDSPTNDEIERILDKFRPYEKVIIYYPKYLSLLSQGVGFIDITQTSLVDENTPDIQIHVIFEPELEKILTFFEEQVRQILFLRVLFETEIARTSARLVSMTTAEEKAEILIKEKNTQYRKALKNIINLQLLETFTGISRWRVK